MGTKQCTVESVIFHNITMMSLWYVNTCILLHVLLKLTHAT